MVTHRGRQRALEYRQTGSGTIRVARPGFSRTYPLVAAHPNEGLSLLARLESNGITNESNFISLIGNDPITIYGGKTHFNPARGQHPDPVMISSPPRGRRALAVMASLLGQEGPTAPDLLQVQARGDTQRER